MKNTCKQCGIEFKTNYRPARTCGKQCYMKLYESETGHYAKKRAESYVRHNKTCEVCSAPYETNKVKSKLCSPECRKVHIKRNAKLKATPRVSKTCKKCDITFEGTPRQKYCSKECRDEFLVPQKNNKCLECDVKIRAGKYCSDHKHLLPSRHKCIGEIEMTCKTCESTYTGKSNTRYCSKRCKKNNPTRKAAKKAAKRGIKEAKLSIVSWKELQEISDNCPSGHHVDHIHHLNGGNCSGLHVPWNLQYLSEEDNLVKSNKFDGTFENEGWKISKE